MRKRTVAVLAVFVVVFGVVYSWGAFTGYANPFNPYNAAIGQLARAETAQTPDEVSYHAAIAKGQLPESGYVSWWSTEKGDFGSIQARLDDIISRTRNISSLEPQNEVYLSEMSDMHLNLKEIQETLMAF